MRIGIVATVVGPPAASRRSSREPTVRKTVPEGARATAYGWSSDASSTVTRPVAGSTRSSRPGLFSTSSSVPAGSSSIDVGSVNVTGGAGRGLTVTERSLDVRPPARAAERPAAGGREDERRPVRAVAALARAASRFGPLAETRTAPRYEAGRTASRIVQARPATGAAGLPATVTRTGGAAAAVQAPAAASRSAIATTLTIVRTTGGGR